MWLQSTAAPGTNNKHRGRSFDGSNVGSHQLTYSLRALCIERNDVVPSAKFAGQPHEFAAPLCMDIAIKRLFTCAKAECAYVWHAPAPIVVRKPRP